MVVDKVGLSIVLTKHLESLCEINATYLIDERNSMGGFDTRNMNPREAERLLRECRDIVSDVDKYLSFCQARTPLLKRLFSQEGMN
jgi:hypothetical protein